MRKSGSVVVWWLVAAVADAGEMPEGYAKPVNALASRLVSAGAVYEEGQDIILYLDVLNVSDRPVDLACGSTLEGRLRLTDGQGRSLQPRKQTSEDNPFIRCISPGKQVELSSFYVSGNEYAMHDPLKPGRYRAIWTSKGGETLPAERYDHDKAIPATGRVAPESNAVVFEVVPRRPELVVPGSEVSNAPWGEAKVGLQTRIASTRNKFYANSPVPMKVEMENVSQHTLHYHVPQVATNGWIEVRDSRGKPVRYIGGSFQTMNPLTPIKPGESHVLDEFDLGRGYFLVKPGKYTAHWPGCKAWGALSEGRPKDSEIPATNIFSFEIVPSAQPSPIAEATTILEERGPKDWDLEHNRHDLSFPWSQPGTQWRRVPCSGYDFTRRWRCDCGPTTTKGSMHTVSVWLAREKAVEEPWQIDDEKARPSEYLGETPFGHLYVEAGDPNLAKHWPTAKSDIAQWLKAK